MLFLGREYRQSVMIKLPVLIALYDPSYEEESEITLGINGIFDTFEINFKKKANKIIFKKAK